MKAWLALGVILLTLVVLGYRTYLQIFEEPWESEQRAEQIAIRSSDMNQVDNTEIYNGEKSYVIVYGKDEQEDSMIVWVGEEEGDVTARYAKDGITENILEQQLKKSSPEKEIIRIVPGKWEDELVWEVFYKQDEEQGDRHYYDFYRFSDGELLETYTMSIR
ncbi:DUF5590 domain-containing protein [Marinicrinis lubricantis]